MGRERVHRESDAEMALGAAMAQQWSQNLALTGHTIVHVESTDQDWSLSGDRRLTLTLDNGTVISVVGTFQVLGERGKPQVGHSTRVDEDEQLVIEDAEWTEIT